MNFEELSACLKCGQEPALIQHFGQWTVQCRCGVKQGHRFFNRQIAISEWNQNGYRYVAECANRQEGKLKIIGQKLMARRLFDLKKLPDDAFLSFEDALLLTGKTAKQLNCGRHSGALVCDGEKFRKRELLSTDFDSLRVTSPRTRAQRRFRHDRGTPEREAEEAAYREEMFALPDTTLFTKEQIEFFACTSRDCINRNLREGKLRQTNGLFRKSDVIEWRRKYPPVNRGGNEIKALKKLDFMLKGKEVKK